MFIGIGLFFLAIFLFISSSWSLLDEGQTSPARAIVQPNFLNVPSVNIDKGENRSWIFKINQTATLPQNYSNPIFINATATSADTEPVSLELSIRDNVSGASIALSKVENLNNTMRAAIEKPGNYILTVKNSGEVPANVSAKVGHLVHVATVVMEPMSFSSFFLSPILPLFTGAISILTMIAAAVLIAIDWNKKPKNRKE